MVLGAGAAAADVLGLSPVLVLVAAGVLSASASSVRHPSRIALPVLFFAGLGAAVVATTPSGLAKLFVIFLKIGAVVFGSGYVLLAFLRSDLVERTHWLTEHQLIDAVAIGQFTPGPVFTTATFIGYVVAGLPGAIVATLGIFAPSFVLVAASGPLIPRLRRSRIAGSFLDGVNVASLALMSVVAVQLGRTAIVDVPTLLFALLSGAALIHGHGRGRINSAWLVLGGGVVGAVVQWLR